MMLVRVYNKPDSAITPIAKRARLDNLLAFGIRHIIATAVSSKISINGFDTTCLLTSCINV